MRIRRPPVQQSPPQPTPQQPKASGPNLARQSEVLAKMARMRQQQEAADPRSRKKKRGALGESNKMSGEKRAAYEKLTGRNQKNDLDEFSDAD